MFSGRDGYVVMRQALRGQRSGASFPFHGHTPASRVTNLSDQHT